MIKLTDTQVGRATGMVTARTGQRHTVGADDGRTLVAYSATPYNPGARVTVLGDAIVGSGGAAPIIKNYQQ